jgi:hypothetical protein
MVLTVIDNGENVIPNAWDGMPSATSYSFSSMSMYAAHVFYEPAGGLMFMDLFTRYPSSHPLLFPVDRRSICVRCVNL